MDCPYPTVHLPKSHGWLCNWVPKLGSPETFTDVAHILTCLHHQPRKSIGIDFRTYLIQLEELRSLWSQRPLGASSLLRFLAKKTSDEREDTAMETGWQFRPIEIGIQPATSGDKCSSNVV